MEFENILSKGFYSAFTEEKIDFLLNLNTKQIPLKESGISARVFNHWKNSGLVLAPEKKNEKRKREILSFVEFLWLKCVEEMRDFGIHYEIIIAVKKKLFTDVDPCDLQNAFNEVKKGSDNKFLFERYKKHIADIKNSTLNEKEKEAWLSIFDSDSFFKEIFKVIKFNYFELLLLSSIDNKQEFGILIKKDRIIPYLDELLEFDAKRKEFFYETHVYFSITKIYHDFLNEETKQKYSSSCLLLNENENAVLSFMKKEEFQEISIKKEKDQTMLTGKMKIPYKVEEYSKWKKKTKLKYPYCEINEKQHDGKISSIEIIVKEFIKK